MVKSFDHLVPTLQIPYVLLGAEFEMPHIVLASNVLIDRYLFNIKVGLFDTLNIFKSLNTNSLTASGKGHRRRKIRPPAAKDRALRGALGKGPPRARLLPEPLRITGAPLRLEELDFRIKKNRGERVECLLA